jgi:hypothetical protein
VRALAFLALAACGSSTADTRTPDTCVATGRSLGKKLTAWKPPAGCTVKGGAHAPKLLASDADARAHVACEDPKASLGIDFAKQQLVVTARSFSPAQVGLDVYDDGKQITFVSRQRSPCKNDPRPMPGPDTTFVFETTGGTRTFADGSCNVESKCP